jgi:hypothetical protein
MLLSPPSEPSPTQTGALVETLRALGRAPRRCLTSRQQRQK